MSLIYKIITGVFIGLAVFYLGQWKGHNDGKIEQLKDSVEAVQTRESIDSTINNSDDYAVCIALGGLPDDCRTLRRMEEAAKPE